MTMTAVAKKKLTPQEYLTQERQAPFKSEYYRGEVFAMAGASLSHSQVKDNLAGEARSQLKGGPCRAITSDMRVKVDATGLYTYPDVTFYCGEPMLEDAQLDTLLNPRAIVEVLSDSTEKYDRGTKFEQYRQIPSLREYILIAQDRPLIERYVRQPDETWVLRIFNDMSQAFEFASITATIPLSEIYRDVMFEKRAAEG
jgi:Uma2 family endonuclease